MTALASILMGFGAGWFAGWWVKGWREGATEPDERRWTACRPMMSATDGNRPLPFDRDELGRKVREAWVRWALTQPDPKPSWLLPYDDLSEPDKEADRQIGEAVARWTLIGDAGRFVVSFERETLLLAQANKIIEAILAADERGQGLPWQEAMDQAYYWINRMKELKRLSKE